MPRKIGVGTAERDKLKQIRGEFVAQWGALGTQWGINRTMAQVHALLMTSIQPLTTDEVMEEFVQRQLKIFSTTIKTTHASC